MTKIAKAKITLELEFLDGIEAEGFNAWDSLHTWARQVSCGLERDQDIFLGDYTLVDTEPFVELKTIKLYIPQRDEPYISTKEDEQQFRCSNPKRVSNTAFAHWLLKSFDISFDIN